MPALTQPSLQTLWRVATINTRDLRRCLPPGEALELVDQALACLEEALVHIARDEVQRLPLELA